MRGAWYARAMTALPVVRTVTVGAQPTWCYTEAPSPDAVRRSYQALGIDLDPRDVAEVQVLP